MPDIGAWAVLIIAGVILFSWLYWALPVWLGMTPLPKAKYECTICGFTEIDARMFGCGERVPRYVDVPYETGLQRERVRACPMELRNPIRRFLWYKLGWRWAL